MNSNHIAALDRDDPLASCRDRFTLPDGVIYLDGNSMGALPRSVIERTRKVVAEEWGGRPLLRISVQTYNTRDDLQALEAALAALL